jgi:PAS domain S-box-containing protein
MAQPQVPEPDVQSLSDLWQLFSEQNPQADLTGRTLTVAVKGTRSRYAILMLMGDNDQDLGVAATLGFPPSYDLKAHVALGEGLMGWVAQNRRPQVHQDGAAGVPFVDSAVMQGVRTSLCVPIVANDQSFGALYLGRVGEALPFSERDVWYVSLLVRHLASSLLARRLSEQLDTQRQFVTHLLESIPGSLVVIDRNLRVVSVNQNFLDKNRREARSTLGRKIEQVFPQVLLDFTRLPDKVREVFNSGQPIDGGKVAYRAPGLPTHIYLYRFIPLGKNGTPENVLFLMDDITDRERLGEEVRRAERYLASVVECANDLVVSLDPYGRIVTWNHAAERTSGLRAEQVKGQTLLSMCVQEQQALMSDMLRRLVHGEGVQNTEVDLSTTGGREIPIAWSCSPMLDDAGHVMAIVAVGRDLTEQRHLEAQLVQSAKMASLGVMAGGIAHELRNPLGIISASAQLLLEKPDDPKLLTECAERIERSTKRASIIIENLLKFARPQGNVMEEVDLHHVLEETSLLLSHQMKLEKVNLQTALRASRPTIYGNSELLQQVFTNLILNACNAMPDGGTLTITTRTTESNQVEIEFADTGCGIPIEHRPKIFDPFFTTMPVGRGTGLGLSISYSIVQSHGGTIDVQSQVNEGTVFTVRLPRRL